MTSSSAQYSVETISQWAEFDGVDPLSVYSIAW